jgi:hypothetical protein
LVLVEDEDDAEHRAIMRRADALEKRAAALITKARTASAVG